MSKVYNMLEKDFLSYLGTDETNLLASFVNLNPDLGLFKELDDLYRELLRKLRLRGIIFHNTFLGCYSFIAILNFIFLLHLFSGAIRRSFILRICLLER